MTKQGATIAAFITLATLANAQLQFTGTSATEEGAIRLAWQSESNTVYRVEYADQLNDPNLEPQGRRAVEAFRNTAQ